MSDRVELMEAALEGHPEGIALVDAAGRVLFWNRAAEAMTGFAGIEMVARTAPCALEPLLQVEGAEDEAGDRKSRTGCAEYWCMDSTSWDTTWLLRCDG